MNNDLDNLINSLVEQRDLAASLAPSREMSLCITKIDEAIMWSSAAKTLEHLNQEATKMQNEAMRGQS